MRAVVLVGGFGTRLRPLTHSTPKQMLPVVHRPMIERVVEHLGRHGVTCLGIDQVLLDRDFVRRVQQPEVHTLIGDRGV